jgi:hypothetical protein
MIGRALSAHCGFYQLVRHHKRPNSTPRALPWAMIGRAFGAMDRFDLAFLRRAGAALALVAFTSQLDHRLIGRGLEPVVLRAAFSRGAPEWKRKR